MQQMWCIVLTAIFLTIAGITDIKSREIPTWLIILFLATGIFEVLFVEGLPLKLLTGMTLGVFSLLLGYVSRWQLGEGDGLAIMITGIFMGVISTIRITMYALFLCGIFGGIMLALRLKGRKSRLPFLPFMLIGFGIDIISKGANICG